ncbi:hypothetical protein [Mycobacterium sp. 1245805.9]|uniref:hypothetical protein n=1 Tax=Mycobacterium sp. 1245805.9 TaxID=1856862 RepID=UPI0008021E06|nr:hypothetical protein [Mycobacterium sp. 1245805.9]OBI79986.1 hypothetical protein A9X00_11550 [Mycobacterium sp. 1245805.9]
MTAQRSARLRFASKRNQYVLPDYSQSTELDLFAHATVLRQLVLHGLVTVVLVAAAVAMSW